MLHVLFASRALAALCGVGVVLSRLCMWELSSLFPCVLCVLCLLYSLRVLRLVCPLNLLC